MNRVDHLMWGASDLDVGVAKIADLTGLMPVPGGSHPGNGTRNALLSLGRACYLEILAPDPAQPEVRPIVAMLAAPQLLTFAIACDDIDAATDQVAVAGLPKPSVFSMSRAEPEGGVLSWRIALLQGHPFGPAAPFLIEWGATPHPSLKGPQGATLARLEVRHPEAAAFTKLMQALGVAVSCTHGGSRITAMLDTPKGPVTLSGDHV